MLLPVATYLPGSVCNHSIYDAIVTVSIYTDAYNYTNNHQTPQMNTPHWRFCTMHTTTRCSSCQCTHMYNQSRSQTLLSPAEKESGNACDIKGLGTRLMYNYKYSLGLSAIPSPTFILSGTCATQTAAVHSHSACMCVCALHQCLT